MTPVDWTSPRPGQADYSYAAFAAAKAWFFAKWCELAAQRGVGPPADLSGSCKYGSLFMQAVFGGALRGHFEHQYNYIGGRVVDLSHDAADVGRMAQPYLHEPSYFELPELQASLAGCRARAEGWAAEFIDGQRGARPPGCPEDN